MAHRLKLAQVLAAAAGLALSAGSTAQALTDPTRPPLQLMMTAAGVGKDSKEGAEARPRLESILLSSARKGAIINGQYVALGGAFGKAAMVNISATTVTLKTGQELEVLQLYPPRGGAAAVSATEDKTEKMVKRP
jgi:hypothetical protein